MKKTFGLLALLAALTTLGATQARAGVITVDNDHVQCPTAQFTSIQAAVFAANPGDTIRVCPGTYTEQVAINKNLTVVGYEVDNQNLAVVMPAGVVPNSTSLTSGNAIAAIIVVDGAKNVTISNLTVDGAGNAINGCAPTFVGIYYRNSSGKIDSVAVRNIKLGAGLEGCQSGLGIFAQSGGGGSSKVDIGNSSVHDYQKNGITGNEAGTDLTIHDNTVVGLGSTQFIAQNGIQLAYGAKGTVESNAVIDHIYSLCVSTTNCSFTSANVLIFNTGDVKIRKNHLGKSQVNIDLETNGAEVTDNTIFETDVFDGIFIFGDNNKVMTNTIFKSDEAAVFVSGNNNKANANTINETPVGIFDGGSSNGFNGNKFFNTGIEVSRSSMMATAAAATLNSNSTVTRSNSASRP